ncbi:hypothetical protein K432DRAFT_78194 [Lepidopterella palustris CBS 459.81]|uniref:Uncharacterized protein n=1 Tax=Lepidopterella palustris CBS 459.81 TaxID=1314670 RepID=A0A8E2E822_9PEZI|nr:hypothetical protein K432DRAFT_78194 [Lepidopterella palustris CBS 459.81]
MECSRFEIAPRLNYCCPPSRPKISRDFRTSETGFFCCYEECGIYTVSASTETSVIPSSISLPVKPGSYLILLDSEFVEIRNVDNGRLPKSSRVARSSAFMMVWKTPTQAQAGSYETSNLSRSIHEIGNISLSSSCF